MTVSNSEKSSIAEKVIVAHASSKGAGGEDLAAQSADLLADIAHLCHQKGIVFEDVIERGLIHFESEIE